MKTGGRAVHFYTIKFIQIFVEEIKKKALYSVDESSLGYGMDKKICVELNITIKEAIKAIDDGARKMVLVIDEANTLLGIVTDSDIRRYILQNGDLDKNVSKAMQKNPVCLYEDERKKIKPMMVKHGFDVLPIINRQRKLVDVVFLKDIIKDDGIADVEEMHLPIVIMAGGKGTRLQPYTNIIPKPLIPIGDTTIVERIIQKFTNYGCDEFYMTVNYKKNMIKSYFEDIAVPYTLEYVEEEKFLGTGGSLFFLKDRIETTFFVSNCDVLIDADYSDILKHHKQKGNQITLVTSLKNFTIPYGVVHISKDGDVSEMKEKPEYDFLVNTGMYILEPETLKDIPENEFFHITDLINQYIKEGKKVGVYPITGNAWLDMGELKEMERMVEKLGL